MLCYYIVQHGGHSLCFRIFNVSLLLPFIGHFKSDPVLQLIQTGFNQLFHSLMERI